MSIRNLSAVLLLGLFATIGPAPASAQDQSQSLMVFAAASMKNALDDANAAYTKETGTKIVASYAASSALMKQIEAGAPADIFLSADLEWMDYGIQKKAINDASRLNLLGNRLVLIAPKASAVTRIEIVPGVDLIKVLGDGRIATGDVRAVPVGRYAKAALEKLGVWAAVEPRIAMAENVRAALTLVARNEAPLGIVYETDAKVEPKVNIVATFPAGSHPAIIYPVAMTVTAKPIASSYMDFLRSQEAKTIFERYGFSYLIKLGS